MGRGEGEGGKCGVTFVRLGKGWWSGEGGGGGGRRGQGSFVHGLLLLRRGFMDGHSRIFLGVSCCELVIGAYSTANKVTKGGGGGFVLTGTHEMAG